MKLEYKGYNAIIRYDTSDGFFVGEVLGICDCLYFHGASAKELKEMFRQSIDNYLNFCNEIGKVPDHPNVILS